MLSIKKENIEFIERHAITCTLILSVLINFFLVRDDMAARGRCETYLIENGKDKEDQTQFFKDALQDANKTLSQIPIQYVHQQNSVDTSIHGFGTGK